MSEQMITDINFGTHLNNFNSCPLMHCHFGLQKIIQFIISRSHTMAGKHIEWNKKMNTCLDASFSYQKGEENIKEMFIIFCNCCLLLED